MIARAMHQWCWRKIGFGPFANVPSRLLMQPFVHLFLLPGQRYSKREESGKRRKGSHAVPREWRDIGAPNPQDFPGVTAIPRVCQIARTERYS